MKTIIIDTNGFLRLFLNDIPKQADQVEQIIHKAKKEQVSISVPSIILFEINFILDKFYNLEKQDIIQKLKSLIVATYLHVESRDIFSKALYFYEKNNVSLVDSFLIAKAQEESAELFTLDKRLDKLQ